METKARWLLQLFETITVGRDKDKDKELTFAKQYGQWLKQYDIADEGGEEVESVNDVKRRVKHIQTGWRAKWRIQKRRDDADKK